MLSGSLDGVQILRWHNSDVMHVCGMSVFYFMFPFQLISPFCVCLSLSKVGRLQVNRRVIVKEGGEMECEIFLGPYESPDVPEQFLVVRT